MTKKVRANNEEFVKEYVVIVDQRIAYETDQLESAIAFRLGRQAGAVWCRMTVEYRQVVAPAPRRRSSIRKSA